MAAGDVFSAGPTSVAAAGYLNVQPSSGVEAVVHNLYRGQERVATQHGILRFEAP